MTPERRLLVALEESVKLQSHYAGLKRLEETGTLKMRRRGATK